MQITNLFLLSLMLISLVLGYKKFKYCSMDIYLEKLMLGVKIKKLRNPWVYTREGGALFLAFYGKL